MADCCIVCRTTTRCAKPGPDSLHSGTCKLLNRNWRSHFSGRTAHQRSSLSSAAEEKQTNTRKSSLMVFQLISLQLLITQSRPISPAFRLPCVLITSCSIILKHALGSGDIQPAWLAKSHFSDSACVCCRSLAMWQSIALQLIPIHRWLVTTIGTSISAILACHPSDPGGTLFSCCCMFAAQLQGRKLLCKACLQTLEVLVGVERSSTAVQVAICHHVATTRLHYVLPTCWRVKSLLQHCSRAGSVPAS
jgi:hypothetical protein